MNKMRDLYTVGLGLMAANCYYESFQCRWCPLLVAAGPWLRIWVPGGGPFIVSGRSSGFRTLTETTPLTARVTQNKSADQVDGSNSVSIRRAVKSCRLFCLTLIGQALFSKINIQFNSGILLIHFRTPHQKETCIRFRISSKLGSFSELTFPCRTKKSRRTNNKSISISILQKAQQEMW